MTSTEIERHIFPHLTITTMPKRLDPITYLHTVANRTVSLENMAHQDPEECPVTLRTVEIYVHGILLAPTDDDSDWTIRIGENADGDLSCVSFFPHQVKDIATLPSGRILITLY